METIPLEVIKEKNEESSETDELLSIDSVSNIPFRDWLSYPRANLDIKSKTSLSIVNYFTLKTEKCSSVMSHWLIDDEDTEEHSIFFEIFYDNFLQSYDNLIPGLINWNTNTLTYAYRYLLNESSLQNIYKDFDNFLNVLVIDTGIKDIYKYFIVKNILGINRFLTERSYLVFELKNIYMHINKYFGNNFKKAVLKYMKDPEEDFEGLYITIKTKLPFKKALRILNRLYKEYWFSLNNDIKKTVSVTIDKE